MMTMTIPKNTLKDKRLNSTDKLIMELRLNNPKINDSDLARAIGHTRQSISSECLKMRKMGALKAK